MIVNPRKQSLSIRFLTYSCCLLTGGAAAFAGEDADLNPVKFNPAPEHEPVVLAQDGKILGNICILEIDARKTNLAIQELQRCLEEATGGEWPVIRGEIKDPAIVIGDGAEAQAAGLTGKELPTEGFAIKTAPNRVYIVGNGNGVSWGIYEFLERYVGIRWYWPDYKNEFGRSGVYVPETKNLVIKPVHLTDAPVFPKRHRWPSGGPRIGKALMTPHDHRMRCANTWPISLRVHAPGNWADTYKKDRPEIFQLRRDGERDFSMLCYGNPRTLETYLEQIEAELKLIAENKPVPRGMNVIDGKAITVSPADIAVSCYCEDCQALWNHDGGDYGTASPILGTFVAKLGREVKKRWPDMTVVFLPYKNYTFAPEGIDFPDNVQVQVCGMPGLAQYKDSEINASMQANTDKWMELTGNKIQDWHYSCWPAHRTKAAYLFPYTARQYYRDNRDKTVGSFINGVGDHWPRQHLSLYVWLKALWNPDIDVDAIVDSYCKRMYGPASDTMRELVGMLISGWEDSEWSQHTLSPRAIYEESYPREDVIKMEKLLAEAYKQAADNELVKLRLDYYAPALREFFKESELICEGKGAKPFSVYQVPENPVIDGKLDDQAWENVPTATMARRQGTEPAEARFPTEIKAVWSRQGVTFGFRMSEPEPEKMARDIGKDSRDASLIWWNENIEIFLDPTGEYNEYVQFIVNVNGAVFDSIGQHNIGWTAEGLKTATFIGKDYWTAEVYIPYSSLPNVVEPNTGVEWLGNFTRHRVGDRKNREYQAYNMTANTPSHDQNAFVAIRFIER